MKKRTKSFLKVLLGVFVLAVIIQTAQDGARTPVSLLLLFCVGWVLWKALLFLRAFFKSAIEAAEPAANKLINHADQSLRIAGLGKVADIIKGK